jgi:hypothetical protein
VEDASTDAFALNGLIAITLGEPTAPLEEQLAALHLAAEPLIELGEGI